MSRISKGRSEATPKDITCETPSAQTDDHYENSTERPSVNSPHAVYWSVLHHKNVSEPSNGSTKNMFSHADRKQTDHAKPINLLDESHIDTPYGSLDSDLNDNVDTHEHPTPNQDHLDTIPSQSAIAGQVAVSFTPSSLQDDGSIPKVVLHERQGLLKEMSTQSALSGYGSTSPSMSPSTSLHYPSDVKAAPQQMQQELTFDGNVDQDIKKENSRWNRIREMVITDELFIHNIPEMDCENVNGSNSIRHNYLGSVVSEHQSNRPLNGKASFLASFRSPQTSSVRSAKKWSDLNDLPNEFTLRECFFLFLILLVIGVIAYSFLFEKWPIIDSIYFTIVCLTTVGYGDRTPSTPEGKLFAALFALGGVVVLGLALGIVGSRLVEAEIRYTEKMKAKTSKALESAFTMGSGHKKEKKKQYTESKKPLLLESQHSSNSLSSLESVDSMCSTESMHSFAAYSKDRSLKDFLLAKENESLWGKLRSEFVQGFGAIQRHVPGFVPMLVGALIMAWLEKWKWYDAVYYCVVTATTIGFGDLTPKHTHTKCFAIVFIPIAVAAMGYILGNLASYIIEHRREDYNKKLWSGDLKLEDIEALDTDNDGAVSELEYIRFMLVAMKKVDGKIFDDLHNQFCQLDTTGDGKITKRDLMVITGRKMRRISHKLMLSEYKRSLIKEKRKSVLLTAISKRSIFPPPAEIHGEIDQQHQ